MGGVDKIFLWSIFGNFRETEVSLSSSSSTHVVVERSHVYISKNAIRRILVYFLLPI